MPSKHISLDRALRSPRFMLWAERDRRWAQRLYVATQTAILTRLLLGASWLGDGIFWYALIAVVGLTGGTEGRDVATQMLMAGIVNLTIYCWIKRAVSRPRPYVKCAEIRACARALDQFSFPSGHVLHAVTFTIIFSYYYPRVGLALLPVIALIALSRVALGLHYPSDVAAGAALGVAVSSLVLALY